MPPISLSHYLSKAILVSLKSLFEGEAPIVCKLISIEERGIWLESEDFNHIWPEISQQIPTALPIVFFPFEQIGYVLPAFVAVHAASLASAEEKAAGSNPEGGDKASRRRAKHKTGQGNRKD